MNTTDQKQVLMNTALNKIRDIYKPNSTFSTEGYDAGMSPASCREEAVEMIMWELERELKNV